MKCIDILKWICRESIESELMYTADIPPREEQTAEWWQRQCEKLPPTPLDAGTYLYYYASDENHEITDEQGNAIVPDLLVSIEWPDGGGMDFIYFYKIDE